MTRNWKYAILLSCKSAERRGTASEKRRLVSLFMRHSYAVASLQIGDDVKTVQNNLGHATAAFTLDVYGHVTDQMKEESANRMERFIHIVKGA